MDNILNKPMQSNKVTRLLETILNSRAGQVLQAPLNLAKSRIAQPIIEATQQYQNKQYVPAALNTASAIFSATPAGNAMNLGETGISALLQTIRGKGSLPETINTISRGPSSGIVSQGLGVGGIAGAAGDMAVMTPRQSIEAARNLPKLSILARNSLKNPRAYEFLTKRNTIDSEDMKVVENAVDILKSPKKYKNAYADVVNTMDLLADRYIPTNVIDKFKGNSLKMANWIIKNRPVAQEMGKDASGRYMSNMNKSDGLTNLLQYR